MHPFSGASVHVLGIRSGKVEEYENALNEPLGAESVLVYIYIYICYIYIYICIYICICYIYMLYIYICSYIYIYIYICIISYLIYM